MFCIVVVVVVLLFVRLFVCFGRQPDQVLTGIEKLSLCIQYHFFFKFMLLLYTNMLHASLALSIHTALFVH